MSEIVVLEKRELTEMLNNAAKFGASIALEEFKGKPALELMTVKDLCAYLRCTPPVVYSSIKKGMPFEVIGDTKRFRKSDVDSWLRGGK